MRDLTKEAPNLALYDASAQTRRHLLASSGSLAALAGMSYLGFGASPRALAQGSPTRLVIEQRSLEVLGRAALVYGIGQVNRTSGIVLGPGKRFNVSLENRLVEDTIIHWHGQTPPYPQDGVVSGHNSAILAGETRSYDYAPRTGTHWMHSHLGLQEQLLLAAPMIVCTPEEARADVQDVIILLADFTFRDPAQILDDLRRGGKSGHNLDKADGAGAMPTMPGMASTRGSMESMPGKAPAPDLNDVTYEAFLANDRTLADPEIVAVERGGRVRLRIINGATTSAFHIDLGQLDGTLVAVDGNPVEPVSGRRFGMAVAQRLDILLNLPREGGTYPILAQNEGGIGRTGLILASAAAMVAKVPLSADAAAPPVDMALEEKLVAVAPLADRPPDITHRIALTGIMDKYVWSIDERTWGNHRPLTVRLGQRVVIEMRNTTMMAHPMHLHGHHFQVIAINGRALRGAVRDTVLVLPQATVTIAFDANNPGRWFFHCHNLFHRDVGMQTEVIYDV